VPPAERGTRWSATHGSFARGPSPHNAQTVAAALTLAESRHMCRCASVASMLLASRNGRWPAADDAGFKDHRLAKLSRMNFLPPVPPGSASVPRVLVSPRVEGRHRQARQGSHSSTARGTGGRGGVLPKREVSPVLTANLGSLVCPTSGRGMSPPDSSLLRAPRGCAAPLARQSSRRVQQRDAPA
jgi:hypothetical protein